MKNFKIGILALLLLSTIACQNEDIETISDANTTPSAAEKKANRILEKISYYTHNGKEFVQAKVLKGNPPTTKGRLDFRVVRSFTTPPRKLLSVDIEDITDGVTGVYIQVRDASGRLSKDYVDITFQVLNEYEFDDSEDFDDVTTSGKSTASKMAGKASKTAAKSNGSDENPEGISIVSTVLANFSELSPGTKFSLVYSVHDDNGNVSRTKESQVNIVPFGGNKRIAGSWSVEKDQIFQNGELESESIIGETEVDRSDDIIECVDGRTISYEFVGQYTITNQDITYYENGTFEYFFRSVETINADYYESMEACALVPTEHITEVTFKGKWRYTNETGRISTVTETLEDQTGFYDVTDPNSAPEYDLFQFTGRLRLDGNTLKVVKNISTFSIPELGEDENEDHDNMTAGTQIFTFKKN